MTPEDITCAASVDIRKPLAAAIQVSDSLVDQWCVTPICDGGTASSYAPVRRVVEHILVAKRENHPDPFLLVKYINREAGCFPPIPIDAAGCNPASLNSVAAAMKEFGEMVQEIADAHADGIFSGTDADRIYAAAEDVVIVLGSLMLAVHRVSVEAEASAAAKRRGPHRTESRLHELRRSA